MHGMLHPHDSSLAFGMVLFTNIHQSTSNNESRTYQHRTTRVGRIMPPSPLSQKPSLKTQPFLLTLAMRKARVKNTESVTTSPPH